MEVALEEAGRGEMEVEAEGYEIDVEEPEPQKAEGEKMFLTPDARDPRGRIRFGSYASEFQRLKVDPPPILWPHEELGAVRRRSVALVFGYYGHPYTGGFQQVQSTPFKPSVEAELELALYRAGAMHPGNFGNLARIRWSRVARTDRQVSAAQSVVVAKMLVPCSGEDRLPTDSDMEGLRDRLRRVLPSSITLHAAVLLESHVNLLTRARNREYHYLIPTYSIAASLDAITAAAQVEELRSDGPTHKEAWRVLEDAAGLRDLRVSAETLQLFRDALSKFGGNHAFGNFANGISQGKGTFKRILSARCSDPFLDAFGREWIEVRIVGSGFLRHQIRKMIATTAIVALGIVPLGFIQAALHYRVKCITSKFPSTGLILARPTFKDEGISRPIVRAQEREEVRQSTAALREELVRKVQEDDQRDLNWVYWLWFAAKSRDILEADGMWALHQFGAVELPRSRRRLRERRQQVQLAVAAVCAFAAACAGWMALWDPAGGV